LINKNVTASLSALAGYGKMMTGHVGIPKCASAYIFYVFSSVLVLEYNGHSEKNKCLRELDMAI
jgi:hypothetical protein